MAITPITSTTGGITPAASSTTANDLAGISGNDFMQVLIKQLQFQDPLKPMDNQQMVQQMATIRELETNTRLSSKLSQLSDQQRFSGATALMGKHVQGSTQDADGNVYSAEGVVKSIRFTDTGDIVLELDNGQSLPLTKLQQVLDGTTTNTTNASGTAGAPGTTTQNGTGTPPTTAKSIFPFAI